MHHTLDKPFKCDHCEYSTASSSSLRDHLRVHTKDKQLKCDQCCYKTFRSDYLESHMRKHSIQHICSFCSEKFSSIANLNVCDAITNVPVQLIY